MEGMLSKYAVVYVTGYQSRKEDRNPYLYNSELGKYCAWAAGYNDKRMEEDGAK